MGKKFAIAAVSAFALFYLLSAPQDAAELVRSLIDGLTEALGQILDFFRNLL
jgi:hypothetical protein